MTPVNYKISLLSLLALAGVSAPAVVSAQKVDQQLSIAAPGKVTFGRGVTVSGRLTGGRPRDVSGQKVTLQRDPFPYEGQFEKTQTVNTDNAGNYSFTAVPVVNSHYRTTAKAGVESRVVTVAVRVALNLAVSDRTPKKGARVKFSGTVAPEHDGKVAHIQRRTSKGWRNIARAKLTDDGATRSRYSKRVRITRSGPYRVKCDPRDEDHLAGASAKVRINVG